MTIVCLKLHLIISADAFAAGGGLLIANLDLMLMFTLNRQSLINPILLSSRIVFDVRITHRRQFTGGVLGSISSGLSAVDHNVRGLIRQKRRSELWHLVWW